MIMAAAIRVRIGQCTQNYLQSLLLRSSNFNPRQKLCFHNTSLLYVIGQELRMPSLSPTMSEGTIVKWLKAEGDVITPGDALCDIQTDKAVMSFETEEEGILAKILVRENTKDVKVGTLIALMVREGEDWKSVEIPKSTEASAPPPSASAPPIEVTSSTYVGFGPAVKLLLMKYNIRPNDVTPTGNRNKLLKSDILKLIATKQLKPVPQKSVPSPSKSVTPAAGISIARPASKPAAAKKSGGSFKDVEVTGMRRTIAKRLSESKATIPHAYGSADCNIDKILSIRAQLKANGKAVSVNDFIIKAVAASLLQCPAVNCHWTNNQSVTAPNIDISVAVSTPNGLITPIVKNAAHLGIEEISATVKDLAKRARIGKLQLEEFQGGSFTISNLGMFGIKEFSAIINPPQCGILAVGGGVSQLGTTGKPETVVTVTLSYDRRAIDEYEAAEFLRVLQVMLGHPEIMLLGGKSVLSKANVS